MCMFKIMGISIDANKVVLLKIIVVVDQQFHNYWIRILLEKPWSDIVSKLVSHVQMFWTIHNPEVDDNLNS